MKICIVTVYNSENCGSFLQAYALGKTLKGLGHEVVYFKRKRGMAPPNWIKVIKSVVIKILEGKHREIPFYLKTHVAFRKWEKYFDVISSSEECKFPCDCYFFGSDTLWNLESEHFLKDHDIYWGKHFVGKRLFTYAISVSNTPLATLKSYDFVKTDLQNFTRISVRDTHTHQVISQLTDVDIFDVCDPTLLIEKDVYDWLVANPITEKYILIYVFEDYRFSEKEKNQIIKYAKLNNMKIISLGENRKWCDESYYFSPDAFITLFKYANKVLTNTFHGTIFSIIYRKNFAAIAKNKIKVKDLLEEFGLTDRNISTIDVLKNVLDNPIDYSSTDVLINEKVLASKKYITECIKAAEKYR